MGIVISVTASEMDVVVISVTASEIGAVVISVTASEMDAVVVVVVLHASTSCEVDVFVTITFEVAVRQTLGIQGLRNRHSPNCAGGHLSQMVQVHIFVTQ
jgi:hypothetical protein